MSKKPTRFVVCLLLLPLACLSVGCGAATKGGEGANTNPVESASPGWRHVVATACGVELDVPDSWEVNRAQDIVVFNPKPPHDDTMLLCTFASSAEEGRATLDQVLSVSDEGAYGGGGGEELLELLSSAKVSEPFAEASAFSPGFDSKVYVARLAVPVQAELEGVTVLMGCALNGAPEDPTLETRRATILRALLSTHTPSGPITSAELPEPVEE